MGPKRTKIGSPAGAPTKRKPKVADTDQGEEENTTGVSTGTATEGSHKNSGMDDDHHVEACVKDELEPVSVELEPWLQGLLEEHAFSGVVLTDPDIEIMDDDVLQYPQAESVLHGGDEDGSYSNMINVTEISSNPIFGDLHTSASSSKSSELKVTPTKHADKAGTSGWETNKEPDSSYSSGLNKNLLLTEVKWKPKGTRMTRDENVDTADVLPEGTNVSGAAGIQIPPDVAGAATSDALPGTRRKLVKLEKSILNETDVKIEGLVQKIDVTKQDVPALGMTSLEPQHADSEFHLALSQLDEKKISDLIATGIDVNTKNCKGETPLHIVVAAYNARRKLMDFSTFLNLVKLLIDKSADVFAVDQTGLSFVFYFLPVYGKAESPLTPDHFHEIAVILSERNVDGVFNTRSTTGFRATFFQEVLMEVDVKDETLFFLRNVDFNAVDESGVKNSVLWYAVMGGHSHFLVKPLVGKYGANLKVLTGNNESLMFAAAEMGDVDLLQYFLWSRLNFKVDEKNNCGDTPLHFAMKSPEKDPLNLTRFFINNGADLNLRNNYYEISLHVAASKIEDKETCWAVIRMLLANKALPTAEDEEGCTFLHKLLDKSNTPGWSAQFHKIVQYIITKNYTGVFQQRDKYFRENPIEKALKHNVLTTDTLSLLHKKNLLLNARSSSTATTSQEANIYSLISCAAEGGNVEGLRYLINLCIDIDSRSDWPNNAPYWLPHTVDELMGVVESLPGGVHVKQMGRKSYTRAPIGRRLRK